MINRVALVGRLTRNPELKRTNQGDAVTSFTIAVNRNYSAKDGQQQADFITCVAWRKMAENVYKYCNKGNLIGVEGKLQSRSYENNQNQKVFVVEVFCDAVRFLESKTKKDSATDELENYFNQGQNTAVNDDDIQF